MEIETTTGRRMRASWPPGSVEDASVVSLISWFWRHCTRRLDNGTWGPVTQSRREMRAPASPGLRPGQLVTDAERLPVSACARSRRHEEPASVVTGPVRSMHHLVTSPSGANAERSHNTHELGKKDTREPVLYPKQEDPWTGGARISRVWSSSRTGCCRRRCASCSTGSHPCAATGASPGRTPGGCAVRSGRCADHGPFVHQWLPSPSSRRMA